MLVIAEVDDGLEDRGADETGTAETVMARVVAMTTGVKVEVAGAVALDVIGAKTGTARAEAARGFDPCH